MARLGDGEVGQPLVADVGAVAIPASMARAGIVGVDVSAALQSRLQQGFLLGMQASMARGDHCAQLAGGDLNAELAQLLKQQRLGDVGVVILVQDEAA